MEGLAGAAAHHVAPAERRRQLVADVAVVGDVGLRVDVDREKRVATLTITGPRQVKMEKSADWYPLRLARELDRAILDLRHNHLDIGLWIFKTKGDPQQVTVITLLVSPEDAQKLALATQEGKIQLALRNPLDEDKKEMTAIQNSQLYHVARVTHAAAATPVKTARAPQKPAVVKVAAKAPYAVEIIEGPKRITTTFDQKDAE